MQPPFFFPIFDFLHKSAANKKNSSTAADN
jgi:hypothetical protein